jgi:hypothetical protein
MKLVPQALPPSSRSRCSPAKAAGDEAEGVRVDVEVGVVAAGPEGVGVRLLHRARELRLEVGHQLRPGDGEARLVACHRLDQVAVGQRADVVEVEGVLAGVVRQVVGGPGGGLLEVGGPDRGGLVQLLLGQGDLGRAQLHGVVPDGLGVVGAGEGGFEVLAGLGVRHGVERCGLGQLGPGL